ncbi:fluoride efflux transporter CrcB [Trichothermofontia sp.]
MDIVIGIPLAIAIGAIPGALGRYYLTLWFTQYLGSSFPYGTLIINLSGSGLMGFFAAWLSRMGESTHLSSLILVGFLGSYTTFSTYQLDTANLLKTGNYRKMLFYWLGSPILGFICVEMGMLLALHL